MTDAGQDHQSRRPIFVKDGRLSLSDALGFGFARVFSRHGQVYFGLTLIPIALFWPLLFMFFAAAEARPLVFVAICVMFMAFFTAVAKLAIQDTRGEVPDWSNAFKDMPWVSAAGFFVLSMVFSLVPGMFQAAAWEFANSDSRFSFLWAIPLALGAALFLCGPIFVMAAYYALDKRNNFFGAFGAAWTDSKPRYARLLILQIVVVAGCIPVVLISLPFMLFPLGVLYAVLSLMYAFVYRSVSDHRGKPQKNS